MVKEIRTILSNELLEEIFSNNKPERVTLEFVRGIGLLEASLIKSVLLEIENTVGSRSGTPVVTDSVEEAVPKLGTWILLPFLIVEVIACII